MPASPFVFEPLFALLRAVFANTDVCVGLTLTVLAAFVTLQLLQWRQYRQAFLLAQREHSFRNFLNRPDPLTGFRFVPLLSTALGILGTFGGITAGLAHFGGSEGTSQFINSAHALVGGMKTAFYASLVGLSGAASFNILQALLGIKVRDWRKQAAQGLQQQQAELAAAAEGRQLAPAQAMLEETRSLNRNMGHALKQQENLMHAVLAMQKLLRPAVDTMGRALEVLEPLPGAVNELKAVHEESMLRLTSAAADLAQFSDNIKLPFALFSNTVDTFDSKVNNALLQFADAFDKTLAKRQAEEQALLVEYRETFVELQNSAASVMDTARRKLATTLNGLDVHLDNIRQTAEADLERIRRTFEAMLEKHQSYFLDALSARQREESELYRVYRDSFGQIQRQALDTMGAAKDGLQAGSNELQQQLTTMRHIASDELAQMRDTFSQSLTGFFEQQQQQLENLLGQQRSGLEISVNKLRSAFDHEAERRLVMHSQWDDAFGKLQEAQKTVGALCEQVNLSQAQALLTSLQRRDAQLSDEVGKEAQALQQVRASLQAVAAQLDELTGQLPLAASQYFDAARHSASRFFQQLDGQANAIVSAISNVADNLGDATSAAKQLAESQQALATTQQRRLLAQLAEGAET